MQTAAAGRSAPGAPHRRNVAVALPPAYYYYYYYYPAPSLPLGRKHFEFSRNNNARPYTRHHG